MAKETVEVIYGRLLSALNAANAFQNTDTLISLVKRALSDASSNTASSTDNRRMKWEYLIKRDVLQHAVLEGKALASPDNKENEEYYAKLQQWLDLALVFTELGATDATYTFTVVQDLLETQTIPSCMKIFDWIERRSRDKTPRSISTISVPTSTSNSSSTDLGSGRLTSGMQPQKGKALVLLRMLNDLLRRLSKAGGETIGFSGRILTYTSQVFPLGERSGVNLRGDYGPTWEMPAKESTENPDKDDFYSTFWSLQLPFSKPSVFATPNPPMTFAQFQDAVDKVLPVIKEATAKERAMMGAGRSAATTGPATLKRKRGQDEEMVTENLTGKEMDYFFAKFLTSPELLDLELADTHFRRQILFQLLIVLHHLLSHTKTEKTKWMMGKNRSLYMPIPEWSLDDALSYGGSIDSNATTETGANTNPTVSTTVATTPGANKDKSTEKDVKFTPTKPSSKSSFSTAPAASTASTVAPNAANANTNTSSSSVPLVEKPERMDPIKWTQITISRAIEELRQTQPPPLATSTTLSLSAGATGSASSLAGVTGVTAINGLTGREFAATVQSLLEREKGWIRWKNDLCDGSVFEKGVWEPSDELLESLHAVEETVKDEARMKLDEEDDEAGERVKIKRPKTMYEATRGLRAKIRGPFYLTEETQKEWQWGLGTEALTEIWAMGYRGLEDLERGFSPGTPHDFLRQLDLEDRKIEMRTKALRAQQERRLQMERSVREKKEQAEREAKEKEVQATGTKRDKEDVDMRDVTDVKDAKETTGAIKKEDKDVEMKLPGNSLPALNSAPTVKTEPVPQLIPVSVSDRASTPIHPSLPPKPGSRAVSPFKAATPGASAPSMSTSSSSASTSTPSTATTTMIKMPVAPSPTPTPALPALPQDEQLRKAEESKTRITWLALRTARDSAQGHLVHFNKIGTGDLRMLCDEIDKAEREREEKEKADKEGEMDVDQSDVDRDTGSNEPIEKEKEDFDPPGLGLVDSKVEKVDRESDVKME